MKKTSTTEENALLISKKAYNDFTTRLRQTLGAIAPASDTAEEAVWQLDKYVKGEITDLESPDIMARVALMMLKPEIDKAMRRSSAARERARLRREKTTSVPASSGTAKTSKAPNLSTDEHPMNRRERREYEQKLAREQRRYDRRMRRMTTAETERQKLTE